SAATASRCHHRTGNDPLRGRYGVGRVAAIGADETELVNTVTAMATADPRPVEDDSVVEVQLRMLAAAPLQADGAATDPRGKRLFPGGSRVTASASGCSSDHTHY